jgi:hypothetical protein
MSKPLREPYFTYGELVKVVTRQVGWTVHDGIIIAPVPYVSGIGAVGCNDSRI